MNTPAIRKTTMLNAAYIITKVLIIYAIFATGVLTGIKEYSITRSQVVLPINPAKKMDISIAKIVTAVVRLIWPDLVNQC